MIALKSPYRFFIMFFGSQEISHLKIDLSELELPPGFPGRKSDPFTQSYSLQQVFFSFFKEIFPVTGVPVDYTCHCLWINIPALFGDLEALARSPECQIHFPMSAVRKEG